MPVINPVVTPTSSSGLSDFTGPCSDWPVKWPCDISTYSPAITGSAVRMATETLWAFTGRQFGLCSVTLRPCRSDCQSGSFYDDFGPPWSYGYYPRPALIGGLWFNLTCGSCTTGCSCTYVPEVKLPAPVYRIVEIKIDGSPLVTGAYRLDDNRIVVRTDGGDWPLCNDLTLDDTDVGTWSITAEYGQLVPEGGAWAVGELACEILRAISGEECRLPANVTNLVRQGVTMTMPSVTELFDKRQTGLYLVDMFIATWNPHKLSRRSRLYSVDGALHRRAGT